MPCLVLGSALAFSRAFASETQFAGRSESQVYCLALENSPLDRLYMVRNSGYRARQSLGEEEVKYELRKPLEEIQLVGIQPGQSRSGQAGSESCLWSGDRPGLKRRQQGSGPRGFSSEIFHRCGSRGR